MRIYLECGKYTHLLWLSSDPKPQDLIQQILTQHIFYNEFEFNLFAPDRFNIHSGPPNGFSDEMIIRSKAADADCFNMAIFVFNGDRIETELRKMTTFSDLIDIVKGKSSIDFDSNMFIFNQTVIENDGPAFECVHNSLPIAFVVPKPSEGSHTLYAQYGCQLLGVSSAKTIKDAINKISRNYSVPKENISLYQNGNKLSETTEIKKLSGFDGTHIVELRLTGMITINAEYQGKKKSFKCKASDSMADIKPKIFTMFSIQRNLRVYYHGDEMVDSILLWSLCETEVKMFIDDPYDNDYATKVSNYYGEHIQDDAAAMYSYGCMLASGKVVKQNVDRGRDLLLRAKDKGHIGAIFALADFLQGGVIKESELLTLDEMLRALSAIDCVNGLYRYGEYLSKRKDFTGAVNNLKAAANYNHVLATTKLGSIVMDDKEGISYFRKSTSKGHAHAMKKLAIKLRNTDKSEMERLLHIAANLESGGSSFLLSLALFKKGSVDEAVSTLRNSALNGHVKSMRNYGILLRRGKCVEKDVQKAARYLISASDAGDNKAKYHLAKMYIAGEGVEKDEAKAFELFFDASETVMDATIAIINMKLRGIGCETDPSGAYSMAKQAAAKGSYKAKRLMAMMQERGLGTEQSEASARELYKEVAPFDLYALYKTAMYKKEESTSDDNLREVIEMLLKASDGKIAEASEELGIIYMDTDPEKAIGFFKKASECGYKLSSYYIGHIMIKYKQDIPTALVYMKDAADNHIKQAIYEYYRILHEGILCPRNEEEALKYLILGTKVGIPDAQMEYGILLFKQQQYEEAYSYMEKAVLGGSRLELSYMSDTMSVLKKMSIDIYRIDKLGHEFHDSRCTVHCGIYAMNNHNYEEAASYFLNAYEAGNLEGGCKYGRLLEEGKGVPQDFDKAIEYYKAAMNGQVIDAYIGIGRIFSNKDYPNMDHSIAIKYYKMAVDLKNGEAMFRIGEILLNGGKNVQQDQQAALQYFLASYEAGYMRAACQLGTMYEEGIGCEVDGQKSISFYKIAIENNIGEACGPYAKDLFFGINTEKDIEGARRILEIGYALNDAQSIFIYAELLAAEGNIQGATELYIKASDLGHVESMNAAAVILSQSDGTVTKACDLFQKAADLGDAVASCNYAIMLTKGYGVSRDYKKALEYFQRAIDGGSIEAIYNSAVLMSKINNNGQYDKEIVAYFKSAADNGNAQAMYNVGVLLTEKEPKDFETGISYLKMAADNKINEAYYKYAFHLLSNSNSPEDDDLAAEYCRRGVEVGDIDCLCLYGVMLLNGRGVPENKEDAISCFARGAESKHLNSMYNLAMMLQKRPDQISQSYDLLKEAADEGFEPAGHQLECYK